MLLVALLPAIGLFIGMLKVPESPRWLVSKGRTEKTLAVPKQVRSPERAVVELEEVKSLVEENKAAHGAKWSDLSVPGFGELS